ncbi:hypothetical protein ABZ897_43390 [Nonomuraea sp. NPDC046802]|uniref:hypothetical protein n=1 Tax=Nonomuraea sp. NPDC046802 TaxID=3154919 RepID=UPI0033F3A9F7
MDRVESVPGMPGEFAAAVYGDTARAFVKAIPVASTFAYLHERERWTAPHLPEAAPTPRMLWTFSVGGHGAPRWLISAWALINDHARTVDLGRLSTDTPFVIDAVGQLGKLLTPCPNETRSIVTQLSHMAAKANRMLKRPPNEVAAHNVYKAALNSFIIDELRGDTLLHSHLDPRHMLIKDQAVSVVGWGRACAGPAWIDPALLAPHFIAGGHTPEQVHTMLWAIPAWRDAPTHLMAGLTALWTLYHLNEAHYAAPPREEFTRLADAGRKWLIYLDTQL